jgi:hypothetical protein
MNMQGRPDGAISDKTRLVIGDIEDFALGFMQ